jgi:RNA polymerase sigma-70 factor (ECF subfamily)
MFRPVIAEELNRPSVIEDNHPDDASVPEAEPTETEVTELRAVLERAVARVCPPWLVDQRDDLVQAAVMKVIEARRKSGEGIDALASSYLYRVAHSALVDEIRRRRRQREVALEEGGDAVEQSESVRDPEHEAAARETGRAIADCLAKMKQERQWSVTLYLQGHSVPESSRTLGWSRKRTENLVYRGLMDLRQCLMKKGIRP